VKVRDILRGRRESARGKGHSHMHGSVEAAPVGAKRVAIVGSPNVGKSALFNALTGAYVSVSNYPGTTVEVTRGRGRIGGLEVEVIDTPGMYNLRPITEEEKVARDILLDEEPDVVVHVVDAKNLERMLPLTLQLMDAGLPVVLDVNLMDEAERLKIEIDIEGLERMLGIPVAGTSLIKREGIAKLAERVEGLALKRKGDRVAAGGVHYPKAIERALAEMEEELGGGYQFGSRAMALLLLQEDADALRMVREHENGRGAAILRMVGKAQKATEGKLPLLIAQSQRDRAKELLAPVFTPGAGVARSLGQRVSDAMMRPLTGVPILLLALFLLYEFVGVFGAGTVVDFLEARLFVELINPWVNRVLLQYVPWAALRELIGGEYGIITLGVRYAVALILPIVGTFFLAFSVIEDSGYLPRLAMLINRVFKKIGLNGRAVIPMVLGLGCDTMATIVTRTLETKRERILSTFLLALAVPCSAQLGVILGLMSGNTTVLVLWTGIVAGVFLLVGYLGKQLLPGEEPRFYMELPPLRWPTPGNLFVKTYTRMEWYFREVFPLFLAASVLIWLGQLSGVFDGLIQALQPIVRWIGLPNESAVAFLFGFFRRDYGAAGLYDLRGTLTGVQLLVAATTMTLFVPCIAQFAVMAKERGWKTALGMTAFIFPFAFLVGGGLYRLLLALGVSL
jgi:ferrous iron transport protein B